MIILFYVNIMWAKKLAKKTDNVLQHGETSHASRIETMPWQWNIQIKFCTFSLCLNQHKQLGQHRKINLSNQKLEKTSLCYFKEENLQFHAEFKSDYFIYHCAYPMHEKERTMRKQLVTYNIWNEQIKANKFRK